jgi:nucleolar protein 12
VEAALLFNEKKYPPLLPRILRVVRAKAVRKTALASRNTKGPKAQIKDRIYNPKMPSEEASLHGRASKLLGRAGAANIKKGSGSGANSMVVGKKGNAGASDNGIAGIAKKPEQIVFEGYRASSKNGRPKDLKMGGGGKKKGKPTNRGAKRASAWKKGGGKKA